jgi:hypothetical protein
MKLKESVNVPVAKNAESVKGDEDLNSELSLNAFVSVHGRDGEKAEVRVKARVPKKKRCFKKINRWNE